LFHSLVPIGRLVRSTIACVSCYSLFTASSPILFAATAYQPLQQQTFTFCPFIDYSATVDWRSWSPTQQF